MINKASFKYIASSSIYGSSMYLVVLIPLWISFIFDGTANSVMTTASLYAYIMLKVSINSKNNNMLIQNGCSRKEMFFIDLLCFLFCIIPLVFILQIITNCMNKEVLQWISWNASICIFLRMVLTYAVAFFLTGIMSRNPSVIKSVLTILLTFLLILCTLYGLYLYNLYDKIMFNIILGLLGFEYTLPVIYPLIFHAILTMLFIIPAYKMFLKMDFVVPDIIIK